MKTQGQGQARGQGRGRPDASALPCQACCRPHASPFSRPGKQVSQLIQVLRTKETLLSDDIYKATNQRVDALSPGAQDSH